MSLDELKEVHTNEDERKKCIMRLMRLFRQLRSLLNKEFKSNVISVPFLGFRLFWSTFLFYHLFQVVIQEEMCIILCRGYRLC